MNTYGTSGNLNIMIPSIIMTVLIWLVFGLIAGLICRNLANRKGYSPVKYFWLGFFFAYITLPFVIGLPLSPELRRAEQQALYEDLLSAIRDQGSNKELPGS